MKKFLASFLIAFTLIFTSTQRSEAVVGGFMSLVISVPALIAVGGVSTVVGGVAAFIGDRSGDNDRSWILFFGGGALMLFGLALLDGEKSVEFSEVNPSMEHLKSVSAEDMAVYNSELDQLNAINAQITAEAVVDRKIDAKARWTEMSEYISPATLKIAGLNSNLLLKSLKRK